MKPGEALLLFIALFCGFPVIWGGLWYWIGRSGFRLGVTRERQRREVLAPDRPGMGYSRRADSELQQRINQARAHHDS